MRIDRLPVGLTLAWALMIAALPACTTKEPPQNQPSAKGQGSPQSRPSAKVKESAGIHGDDNDCNALGERSNVTCVLQDPPPSVADVTVSWPTASLYLATGDPETSEAPPDLGPDGNYNRCLKWNGWLSKKPELFAVTPEVPVAMTVGTNDVAAITEIEGRVFTKRALPKRHFLLKCLYGAGDQLPFLAVADTVEQEVSVYRSNLGVLEFEGKMPPTSISLASKADMTGKIALHSEYGYAYEGAIVVKLRRNGKEEVKVIGTPENPIRWVDNPCPPVAAQCPNSWGNKPAYGWNGSNWEKDFSPFPSEWGANPSEPSTGPMD